MCAGRPLVGPLGCAPMVARGDCLGHSGVHCLGHLSSRALDAPLLFTIPARPVAVRELVDLRWLGGRCPYYRQRFIPSLAAEAFGLHSPACAGRRGEAKHRSGPMLPTPLSGRCLCIYSPPATSLRGQRIDQRSRDNRVQGHTRQVRRSRYSRGSGFAHSG